jgi:hypothetical protein
VATFLILVSSNGIAMALNYSGIILLGSMLSLASIDTNYPNLSFFSDLKAVDAIKFSF